MIVKLHRDKKNPSHYDELEIDATTYPEILVIPTQRQMLHPVAGPVQEYVTKSEIFKHNPYGSSGFNSYYLVDGVYEHRDKAEPDVMAGGELARQRMHELNAKTDEVFTRIYGADLAKKILSRRTFDVGLTEHRLKVLSVWYSNGQDTEAVEALRKMAEEGTL